jgi:SAM-dependent MidA family methyltransferase
MQQEHIVPAGLPEPHPDAARHSRRVAEDIRERVEAAGGRVSFGEFMQLALYAPGLGYYSAGTTKFGADGDFVTAPEVSTLFGRVIASQCAHTLGAFREPSLLELGAGSGALAVTILKRLAELDALPARYLILEVSADLVERQRRLIFAELGEIAERVTWIDELPLAFDGVIIANEVLDALPVERFERRDGRLLQQYVVNGDAGFDALWQDAGSELSQQVQEIETDLGRQLPDGYRSELSLGMSEWVQDILDCLQNGVFLAFDYGVSRREYYADDRGSGWLRCHFRHHAHSSPLIYPGIQDITSWVDFSAVAAASSLAGARVAGFVTQAMFLLNGGLDNEFARFESRPIEEQLDLARQVKLLTLPSEMGESFKSMALIKGDAPIPDAFTHGDRAHTL